MSESFDILIKGSTIVDGAGRPAFEGSIGVVAGRIAAVGDLAESAARVIDGAGLVTSPDFIDPHSHADTTILKYPLAENLVMQGVTTFVGGNCGNQQQQLHILEDENGNVRRLWGRRDPQSDKGH